jgi:hypothetical protein
MAAAAADEHAFVMTFGPRRAGGLPPRRRRCLM